MARETKAGLWLEAVGAQIRWKRARRALLRELEDHITDQVREYQNTGSAPDEAAERAVEGMGDPVPVGRELDRLHRPGRSWPLAAALLLLLCAGVAAVSMTAAPGMFPRQLLALGGGLVLLCAAWFSDYTVLTRRLRLWILIFIVICIGLASLPYFGASGRLEDLLILLPVLYAALVCRARGSGYAAVLFLSLLVPVLAAFSMLLPSFSTAVICMVVMSAVLTAGVWGGGFRVRRSSGLACALLPILLPAGWYVYRLLFSSPYLSARLSILLHPELDPLGRGYEYVVVRGILSHTPFLSLPGRSTQALTEAEAWFLKSAENSMGLDLTWLAARFGWAVLLAAGTLIVCFVLWSVLRFRRLRSLSGRLVALSCSGVLVVQSIGYLSASLGWRFGGADALPFLTYGPGCLVSNLLLAGVLLSVLRMDPLARDNAAGESRPVLLYGPFSLSLPIRGGTLHIEYKK